MRKHLLWDGAAAHYRRGANMRRAQRMFTPFDLYAFQMVTTAPWAPDDDLWVDTCKREWIVAPGPGRLARAISKLRHVGNGSSVARVGARAARGQDGNPS